MRKLEFNPTIIDYSEDGSDMETIATGVKKYVAKPEPQSLKDAIEKLSFEQLYQAFGAKYIQYREPESFPGYFPDPLSDLYNEFLEPKGIDKSKGIGQVYHLICEKIAMDWMNENMKKR